MTTVSQAFDAFLSNISVTEYQKASLIAARKDRVIEKLAVAFPQSSDLPFSGAYLMGSAAKGTIVRPLDDIDVLAVFSNSEKAWQARYQHDSQSFLYRVRRAYDGLEATQVGARGQAVRVFFQTGGHVDIAPVFKRDDDTFHLPSGTGGWLLTSPFRANAWFSTKNADLGYNLAPVVRLAKKWNRAHSKRLQSFHLETMAASSFSSLGSNRRVGLQKLFEWSGARLDVLDPGGHSGLLSSYLSGAQRAEALISLAAANDRALKALAAEASGNHAEAIRLWRIILGPGFGE